MLEEVCEKNRWGRPTYHHLSTVGSNTAVADGSGDVQLFACKVSQLPNSLRNYGSTMGLTLNRSKCEVITRNNISISHDALRDFKQIEVKEAQLFGAPLSSETALQQCLKARTKELEENLSKLALIARQDALLILRSSLGSPKMIHTLRCHPSNNHPELETYDTNLRRGLEQILNVSLNDLQWTQASLPIKMGGLGIRRASSLALPAFLASAASTLPLQTLILTSINLIPDKHFQDMTSEWCSKSDFSDGDSMPTHKQALWDRPLFQQAFKTLLQATADPYNTARLKAASSPHASDWLYALPITACGLRLEDEDVRVAVGLRLEVAICEPHMCACGARIDARGSHGLSCSLGFGRIPRHSTINDIIHRSLSKAGIPSIKEPPGLTGTDGRRPDGPTMIPCSSVRVVIWCGARRWWIPLHPPMFRPRLRWRARQLRLPPRGKIPNIANSEKHPFSCLLLLKP